MMRKVVVCWCVLCSLKKTLRVSNSLRDLI